MTWRFKPDTPPEEVLNRLDEAMHNHAEWVKNKAQEIHIDRGSPDTGQLGQNIHVDKRANGQWQEVSKFIPSTGVDFAYRIHVNVPYAQYVEYGTSPHPVSTEGRLNIKRWAMRKLGLSEREAERVSWAIARKILFKGTDPKPYLRPAIEMGRAEVGRIYRDALGGAG